MAVACCCPEPGDGSKHEYTRSNMNPIEDRKCRDVLFLLLLIAALAGSVGLSIYSTYEADLDVLKYGISSAGGLCTHGSNQDKKYLMYCLNGTSGLDGLDQGVVAVCGDKCPTTGSDIRDIYLAKKAEFLNVSKKSASYWESADYYNLRLFCVAPSFSLLHRCVYDPRGSSASSTDTLPVVYNSSSDPGNDALGTSSQMFMNNYNDIYQTWYICLICGVAGGLVMSFFWLTMLKYISNTVMVVTLVISTLMVFGIDVYLVGQAGWLGDDLVQMHRDTIGEFGELDVDNKYKDYYKVLAIIALACTFIMLCILIAMWRAIRLAIALVKESADCLNRIKSMVFLPLIPAVFMLALFVYFVVFAVYLAANGKVVEGEGSLQYDKEIRYAGIYHTGFCLWMFFFISALHSMVMAGCVSTYYWTHNKYELRSPVRRTISRTLWYHMGSAALGSLVLTAVKLFKWFLMHMANKFKESNKAIESKLLKYILCCFFCCLNCIERFIQFLTKNAYILIAVDGQSFCYATGQAWKLIMSNVRRMTAVNMVSAYLFFLAKVAVACVCALLTSLWINHKRDDLDVTSSFGPMVCTFILSYFIAWLFFEVTDFAVDTLLVCFCLDDLKNRNTENYYASKRLKVFMFKEYVKNEKKRQGKVEKQGSRIDPKQVERTRSDFNVREL